MTQEIISNLDNPRQLEKLYRENKAIFKREFNTIYATIRESSTAQFWNERLNYESEEISWGTRSEMLFVLIASFIAGMIAKIPQYTSLTEEFFYSRNIGVIVFPLLTLYFAWKQKLSFKSTGIAILTFCLSAIYINSLPADNKSDTLVLACIHLPLLLWAITGYTYSGFNLKNHSRRIDFLKYNGDLVVMMALILIAGGILAGVTIGLFSLININIEQTYFEYVGIFGLAAAPIIGTYLVQTNPQLVNKVSPVIAKVFAPLVLITLVVYLGAILYSGKDPYNDREFLMIFNLLLIGVMAIILFAVTETSRKTDNKIQLLILLALSVVTIVVNGIALSAIIFRISEWGFTPNRLAVLGSNILILLNLLLVTNRLFRTIRTGNEIQKVEYSIATYLPVYAVWTIIVTFLFPVMFGFK
jgi:hypothetical protein